MSINRDRLQHRSLHNSDSARAGIVWPREFDDEGWNCSQQDSSAAAFSRNCGRITCADRRHLEMSRTVVTKLRLAPFGRPEIAGHADRPLNRTPFQLPKYGRLWCPLKLRVVAGQMPIQLVRLSLLPFTRADQFFIGGHGGSHFVVSCRARFRWADSLAYQNPS